jgi:uncharacterized protein (DUF1778 family)
MPSAQSTPRIATAPRKTLNMRIAPEDRSLFDRAAQALGKTRTDFILEASRRAAEEAILDRALLSVTPDAYAAFLERLDRPANPNQRLKKSLTMRSPWEQAASDKAASDKA